MKRIRTAVFVILAAVFALPVLALNKADTSIAKYAAIFANNHLSKKLTDPKGMPLFLLARKLTPKADTVLLLEGMLERKKTPARMETTADEEKFIRFVLRRAIEIYPKNPKENPDLANKCLTYYRLVELYFPNDKQVILGTTKLRAEGFDGSYYVALSAWKLKKPALTKVAEPTKAKIFDPKRLGVNVKRSLRKRKDSDYGIRRYTESVELKVELDNRDSVDVEGLTLVAFVIGERVDRRSVYYVAAQKKTDGLKVARRKQLSLVAASVQIVELKVYDRDEANLGDYEEVTNFDGSGVPWEGGDKAGGEYEAWLVVVKDSEGSVIASKASDSKTLKAAAKILKLKVNDHFNRDGEKFKVARPGGGN